MKTKFTNIEAEKSVLGGVFLEPDAMNQAHIVTPDDFTDKKHRLICEAFQHLYRQDAPIDLVSVTTELKKSGNLEQAGGSSYLADLVDYVPTAANIGYYIGQVKECTRRRKLEQVGSEIRLHASESETAADAQDKAESLLMAARIGSQGENKAKDISTLVTEAIKALEELKQTGGARHGILTGFYDLDKMTCGFHPGDLVIIAGRPSMGKTALALDIARKAARNKNNVLIFSLEMNKAQLVNRLLSGLAKIPANRFRNGDFHYDDWNKLKVASDDLKNLPLIIDDRSDITTLDIRAASRREHRSRSLDLIVIDYLQLINPVKSHSVREREVAEMSRSLKALAKELNIPVVVLAQLNRAVEAGGKIRKPIPSDLRESGSLEQDADLILFPWREAAYCDNCKLLRDDCGKGHYNHAEIIIGKQRNGPTGSIHAAWLGQYTTFESIAPDHDSIPEIND